MKLKELIFEDAINNFLNAGVGNNYIGPDSGESEAISQIQQLLSRHSLAIGDRPATGWWNNSQKAWTGPINGEWTPQLTDAVTQWQQSINNQVGRNVLLTNGIIERRDIEYLRDTPILQNPPEAAGFLRLRAPADFRDRLRRSNRRRNSNAFSGRLANPNPTELVNMRDVVEAIGRDGWIGVITPIIQEKFRGVEVTQQMMERVTRERERLLQNIFSNLNQTGYPNNWLNRFRYQVLDGVPLGITSPTIGGEEVRIYPPAEVTNLNGPNLFLALFDHFAGIATYQLEHGAEIEIEREQERAEDTAARRQNDVVNLNDDELTALANALHSAFNNELIAGLLPGGRRFSNDLEQIEFVLSRLRNARDWDALEEQYNNSFDEDLSQRLVDELSDDEYDRIVRVRLGSIRRINPRAMHRAINFADNESITVNVDNTEYTILQNYIGSRPEITPEVQDVILEDTILRTAIQETDGQVPDLFRDFSRSEMRQATETFISVIQNTYPEMVPFYTHQTPFDQAPDVGYPRMRAIIENIALALSQGSEPEDLNQFVMEEILNDRIWLVGENEDDEGAANIHFDRQYEDEGLGGRQWTETPENVELEDDDIDIIERLASGEEDIIVNAIRDLMEKSNPQNYYTNTIYPGYNQRIGTYIDLDENAIGENTVENIVNGQGPDDSAIGMLSREFGIVYAAPIKIIGLIQKTFEFGFTTGGTDEETLQNILNFIDSPEKYRYVNRYYKSRHGIDLSDALRLEDDILDGLDLTQFEERTGIRLSQDEQGSLRETIEEIGDFFENTEDARRNGEMETFENLFEEFDLVDKLIQIRNIAENTSGGSERRRMVALSLRVLRQTPLYENDEDILAVYRSVDSFNDAKELYDEMAETYDRVV